MQRPVLIIAIAAVAVIAAAAGMLALRGDLQVKPIRGNVGTRLQKLADGDYDAIVLAQAGLDRLQLEPDKAAMLGLEVSLPAAGQGALGIECLADSPAAELVEALNDPKIAACVTAERGVSAGLGADCSAPLAAFAQMDELHGEIYLRARLGTPDGTRLLHCESRGPDPEALAEHVVASLYAQGGQDILDQLSH